VPVGYLVTVAVVAVGTLFALVPVRRPRLLAAVGFRFGLIVSELPFAALCWLLIWTLFAAGQGDLGSPGGWACVGLAILTVAGLAVVVWRGLQARAVVGHALAEGLGAGWRDAITPDMAAQLRRRVPLARILLAPLLIRRRDVERVANISYGGAGRANLLDVYRHRSHPPGGPVLIHLPGGGYYRGRKNTQSLPLLHWLASQGWVCISANYRLRPAAQHPDHLIDLKKVIAWVREHGHAYGADPAMLFVAGSSAGAHMAALAALTPGDPAFQPGFEAADTSVTAAICLGGYYGNYYGQGPSSSPQASVRAGAPPFFIAHGDQDTVVPVETARLFAGELRNVSASPVVYAELPGAKHAFDLFQSLRFEAVIDGIEAFTGWIRSREKAPNA
jgi:acetyl esterase/lipase